MVTTTNNGAAKTPQANTGKPADKKEVPGNDKQPAEQPKAEAAKSETPPPQLPDITPSKRIPTIEERLAKLDELNELVEKRENVVEALDNLKKFYVSPTGGGCNIKLTDSKGNSFGVAHPSVIGEMVNMATNKLQDELVKIETALDFTI